MQPTPYMLTHLHASRIAVSKEISNGMAVDDFFRL